MAKRANKKYQSKLTDEEKAFRQMVLDNKSDLIDSKEYFDVGVEGCVLKARIVGAGSKAIKFSFNIGGVSTKKKATPSEFFLDYNELDDNLICQIEDFVDDVEEEVDDEVVTLFAPELVPAK